VGYCPAFKREIKQKSEGDLQMWRCDDLYSGFENLAGGEDSDQQIGGFEDLGLPI
jgi:hypothetical protein